MTLEHSGTRRPIILGTTPNIVSTEAKQEDGTQPHMHTTHQALSRTATRLAVIGLPLLVAATGPVAAQGGMMGGGYAGGMGGGFLGGGMLLWPLLLIGLLLALVYGVGQRDEGTDRAVTELRARYARGELSDDEFESRRATLGRTGDK
jgi:putative membrane protein